MPAELRGGVMQESHTRRGPVRAPQDLVAGLFLIALASLALWAGWDLNAGTMRTMGPGMVPRIVIVLIGACGLALTIGAFIWEGPAWDPIRYRGPFFIALGIIAFGLTVRGIRLPGGLSTPALGILGAGPLSILIGGFASAETRFKELVIFAVAMTAFCWFLFKWALGLPIPLMPLIFGY
ncbi:MAG: tripartite tricarboxylate transporter TctB family protein [Beijerinckiaceae bacterium]